MLALGGQGGVDLCVLRRTLPPPPPVASFAPGIAGPRVHKIPFPARSPSPTAGPRVHNIPFPVRTPPPLAGPRVHRIPCPVRSPFPAPSQRRDAGGQLPRWRLNTSTATRNSIHQKQQSSRTSQSRSGGKFFLHWGRGGPWNAGWRAWCFTCWRWGHRASQDGDTRRRCSVSCRRTGECRRGGH